MKKLLSYLFVITLTCFVTGCSLFSNSSKYTETTKNFTNALLDSNYATAMDLMNLDKSQKTFNVLQLSADLDSLKFKITADFGKKLEYSFMSAQKEAPNNVSYTVPPNTTLVFIELNNGSNIGALRVLFDDKTSKIDK